MSSNFECLVKYNNFNYSFSINHNINSISFAIIYPEIQKMIANVVNHNICFETHFFELFDNKFNEYVIINFNKQINNFSRIRVSAKPQNLFINQKQLNTYSKDISRIDSMKTDINESNASKESNARSGYVSDPRLLKFKLNLKAEDFNCFDLMLKVVKEISNNDMNSLSEYDWNYLIPKKISEKGYRNWDQNYWRNSFNDLMKRYVEILEKSTNYENCYNVFPFFNEFNSMTFDLNHSHYERVMHLRQNMNKMKVNSNSVDYNLAQNAFVVKRNVSTNETLFGLSVAVAKQFHLMVNIIKTISDSNKRLSFGIQEWFQVTDRMIGYGVHYPTPKQCSDHFYNNVYLYRKNFYLLLNESKHNNTAHTVLQLFQIVHTLDLTMFYGSDRFTVKKIKSFERTHQISSYLSSVKQNQIQSKAESHSRPTNHYRSNKTSQKVADYQNTSINNTCVQTNTLTHVKKESVSQEVEIIPNDSRNNPRVVFIDLDCFPD